MKTIVDCALVATALIAGTAVAIAGKRYVSSGQEFEVTIPDGWKHLPLDGPLKLILISPRIEDPEQKEKSPSKENLGSVCVFVVGDTVETRQMTQQQINEAGEKDINDDFWRQLAAASNQDDKVSSSKSSVVSSRTEMRGDRRVYFATLRFEGTFKGTATPYDMRSDLVFHLIPGRALASNCLVDYAKAAAEEEDFKIIADSFNPLGNGVVASVTQPGRAVPIAAVRPAFVARGMLQYTLRDGRDRAVGGRLR
jgi:hypothetical protein